LRRLQASRQRLPHFRKRLARFRKSMHAWRRRPCTSEGPTPRFAKSNCLILANPARVGSRDLQLPKIAARLGGNASCLAAMTFCLGRNCLRISRAPARLAGTDVHLCARRVSLPTRASRLARLAVRLSLAPARFRTSRAT
jgi:hypothetical protein